MYFSKVTANSALGIARELLDSRKDDAYASHSLLWQLFRGQSSVKRFLFREEHSANGLPVFYVLSSEPPASSDVFLCQSKPYLPKLTAGDRLAFKLRANPTVSVRREDGRSRRHDVLMHAKKQVDTLGMSPDEALEAKRAAALQGAIGWMSDCKRLEQWGIQLDCSPEVDIESYQQQCLYKPKEKRFIRFSSVDYQGLLTVVDPDRFINTLHTGVGKAKGFGCGMWMIRRI